MALKISLPADIKAHVPWTLPFLIAKAQCIWTSVANLILHRWRKSTVHVSCPFPIRSQESKSTTDTQTHVRPNKVRNGRYIQSCHPKVIIWKKEWVSSRSKYLTIALHYFSDGKPLFQLCYNVAGWLCVSKYTTMHIRTLNHEQCYRVLPKLPQWYQQ